ncbi:hypothetical protein PMI16_03423 [Herbaspirillum sp. CF444]|uniref:hypothetical protein n=1 Tax=Herbaspirillum sp. CF444 TaxID=1144319 RepID=UPI0002727ECB|nr:hypothetical protein [Herbaspirillum sp. CF444]EJL85643.1 hypothetical protein PMI16_03423 [Herbaspirillum sp. CF444]
MPKYVLYCSQDTPPTVSANGTLSCDGGASAIQVGLLEATMNTPDVEAVGAVWSAAFTMVLLCYAISRGIGSVLQMLREG